MFDQYGAILPNGKLDSSVLIKQLDLMEPEEKLIWFNMGKACVAQKAKDMCERFYNMMRCMKETDLEHFFFV